MSLHNCGYVWERIHNWLPADLKSAQATPYLSGTADGQKAVIRFFKDGNSIPSVVLKGSRGEVRNALESESQVLGFLQSRRSQNRELGFSSPIPLLSFEQGGWSYTMETAAPGRPLSELIFLRSRRRRMEILRHELSRCAHVAANIPTVLEGVLAAHTVDASWYDIPEVGVDALSKAQLRSAADKYKREELCGHGDFTIENVFWDSATGGISVIDWELPMRGVPRLYDMFTLLLSSLPALALEISESNNNQLDRQFHSAFFGTGPWANETRQILHSVGRGVAGDLWIEMLMSLVIRTNYFLWRQPSLGKEYARLLKLAVENEKTFVANT